MTRALITGAHGFVGRHVARRLADLGYTVTGLGHGDWTDDDPANWGLSAWRSADVDGETLAEHGGTPDLIAHCAGSGSVPYSLERPREDFRRTVEATLSVLDFVRLHAPSARVVLPSSAAVYGLAEQLPITVDAPLRPLSPYGVHKKMAEDLARSYAAHFGVSVAIVRLFSVYGPGLRKQLLWDACRKITGGAASFGGDGQETRDWLHVDDAAALLAAAAAAATPACPTFLRGAPATFSGKVRPGDPRHFLADVDGALALGWKPVHRLEDGLDAYADWFIKEAA
jgi:UDP-glucose 4-epimerase